MRPTTPSGLAPFPRSIGLPAIVKAVSNDTEWMLSDVVPLSGRAQPSPRTRRVGVAWGFRPPGLRNRFGLRAAFLISPALAPEKPLGSQTHRAAVAVLDLLGVFPGSYGVPSSQSETESRVYVQGSRPDTESAARTRQREEPHAPIPSVVSPSPSPLGIVFPFPSCVSGSSFEA